MPNGKTNCFVDTNLLIYATDRTEPEKHRRGSDLLKRIISDHTLVLSPQSLNECYHVLAVRRRVVAVADVRAFVWSLSDFCTAPYDFMTTQLAWIMADRFGFGWWDCMLLASATLAGCEIFFSEDMRHRQRIGSMIVLSPFRLERDFDFSRMK